MTMPTSLPHRFMEVRFPADFTAQYVAPLAWFPGASDVPSMSGGGVSIYGRPGHGMYAPEWPPNDGFQNDNQIWHKQKGLDRLNQVATQVRNLQIQRMNQMTHMPYSVMAGGCDECTGGARYGGTPTTIEGARVLAGRGLRGGVMRTLAGRQHVERRLAARVGELDLRDAVAEQMPFPSAPKEAGLTEDDTTLKSLGEYMDILDDSFTSAAIETDTVAAARGVLSTLLKVGWRIPQNLITPTLRQVNEMLNAVNQVAGATNPQTVLTAEKKKRLRTVFQVLERARTVLKELSAKSDLSPQERRMATQALAGELQGQVASQRARIPPQRNPQTGAIVPPQPGQVYPYLPPPLPRRRR